MFVGERVREVRPVATCCNQANNEYVKLHQHRVAKTCFAGLGSKRRMKHPSNNVSNNHVCNRIRRSNNAAGLTSPEKPRRLFVRFRSAPGGWHTVSTTTSDLYLVGETTSTTRGM